jgi:hypothetical protein
MKKSIDQLDLTDSQKDLIRKVVAQAGETIQLAELMPVLFLQAPDGKTHIVGTQFNGDDISEVGKSKDAFSIFAKVKALEIGADFCVFMSESWTLSGADADEFLKNRHKYPNGVVDHPNKIDVLTVMVEKINQSWSGTARIIDRKLGPIVFGDATSSTGRFGSFLLPSGRR